MPDRDIIDEAAERQYALRRRHPERSEIYRVHQARSAAVRETAPCSLDLRYADGPRCTLDLFPAARPAAPMLFFVHGGYWRALDKAYVSFIARPFQDAGISVVLPGYDLVPAVGVDEIVDEIRAAFVFAVRVLSPGRVVVSGHSAGAQLAAMLALDQAEEGARSASIAGLVGVSGVFDLRALLQTSINADLGLGAEEAARLSPLVRLDAVTALLSLPACVGIVGGEETEGFKAWSADFTAAWSARGGDARYVEFDGCTHFDILDRLAEPDGAFLRIVADMIA